MLCQITGPMAGESRALEAAEVSWFSGMGTESNTFHLMMVLRTCLYIKEMHPPS